ncbi:winged helix-turn-helix domain-containing protein, partial [Zavarzinella formosa]|uniref:winged helix-turn-helix domain-containing protein n=1 Tax=Zavarzinella formosa TaxID=360055 RepID=UPI00035E66DA
MSPEQQADLYAALQADPPDGGLWSGPKLARYVRDQWGIEVVPQTGWQWLVRLGFRLRLPVRVIPRPPRRSNSGGAFDRLAERVAALRTAHPDKTVEVWAEDEAWLGLKPVARRVWSLHGHRLASN